MNVVLLSGGSGKRLWPLSDDIRSKQFLKLFKNDAGQYESMVQRIYAQIKAVDADASVTIATSKTQVPLIKEQLGEDVGISIEPSRRDTFPAIALASLYLKDELKVDPEEVVVVCPVDPYVDIEYFKALKKLEDIAKTGESNLVLMGMEPTYPSEKYGYIIPNSKEEISDVDTFKEKPDQETAKKYLEMGALWNGGVFAYKLGYMIAKTKELLDVLDYKDLYDNYDNAKKISFDYAVVENEPRIRVMRFNGRWDDLGTWGAMADALEEDHIGNVIADDHCSGTKVINETEVPVICMGLKDVVVIVGENGVLVTDKERSEYLKPVVERL